MSKSEKAVKSIAVIIVFSMSSRLLGFFREILIAAKFGSGAATDAFFIAITATTLFTTFFSQTINTTLIPILAQVQEKQGKEGKIRYVNNLLNIVLAISFLLTGISWIFAPYITRILAYGFEGDQFAQTVYLLRIGLPVVFFGSISGIFGGYLQSEKRFAESASSHLPFNLVYIIFLLFFADLFGVTGLMVASVIAVASQVLVFIPTLRAKNYRYQFIFDLNDFYLRKNLLLILPILVSVAVSDINKIIDRTLASSLINGSISALNYSNRLKGLITGIFSAAIVTVLYPALSDQAAKASLEEFKGTLRHGINTIAMISIPASVGIIVFAKPIVKISFERGAFDAAATIMTTSALIFYSIGIVGFSVKQFLNRAFYALHDTKTPMYNVIIAIGINVGLNLILVRFMAHDGLALATSISGLVSSGILFLGLRKKIGRLGLKQIGMTILKILIASLMMGAGALYLYNLLNRILANGLFLDLISLFAAVGAGVLIYIFLLYLMKINELIWILRLLKSKLGRKQKD